MDEFNIIVENEEPIDVTTDIQNDFLRGEKGPKGDSNTLTIGTVQKGEEADASIEGDAPNQILNLTLPKGDKGDKPEKGTDYFTTEEKQEIVQEVIKEVNAFDIKIVEELPIEDIRTKVIYFVPKVDEEEQNVYDEYIYINNQWEHIGSTKVDLTDYYLKQETDEIINGIEDKTIIDKTTISGKTSQEGTPSPTNIVPIKNVNVYGVNELKIPDYEFYSYGITTKVNNGKISTKGKTTDTYFYLSDFIDCNIPAGDYIFSLDKTFNFQVEVGIKYSDDTRGDFAFANTRSKKATFTKDVKAYRIAISWLPAGTNIDYNFSAKIEKDRGVEVTQYTPYGYGLLDLNLQKDTDTQTVTLISKRLHQDDNVNENGFHYNRKTLILDGTEGWVYNQASNGLNRFYYRINDIFENTTEIMSTHFKYESTNAYGNLFCAGSSGKDIFILIDLGTADELKTYLAEQYANGTPVTIEYKLAKQENEQFNEANQTAWNTLEDLLINGYTFIDSSSDELQPNITLTEYTANDIYRENVEKFKELEEANIYSTEETVVGKWIDGKTLYRKIIETTAPETTADGTHVTGYYKFAENVENAILEYVFLETSDGIINPLPYITNDGYTIKLYFNANNKAIRLTNGIKNFNGLSITISVLYTKTTD